jgi:hypothetical protein
MSGQGANEPAPTPEKTTAFPASPSAIEPGSSSEPGLTLRSLLIGLLLAMFTGLWVRQSEILVLATQVSESVPTIPALTALVLLMSGNALLRRIPGVRPLSRPERIVIFLFVAVSSMVMGIGVTQFLFALMGTPFYFQEAKIAEARALLPQWLMPHDAEVMRRMFESASDGRVPWEFWWRPALFWIGFFVALGWTLYCLMALFYRAWAQDERLAFPLVTIPMEMTDDQNARSIFRNKLMWFGFALAASYNLVNIAHAFTPSFPAFGKEVRFDGIFTFGPWKELQYASFHFRPDLIGLGYLVSTEISLTVWLSFVVTKLTAVTASAMGYEPRGLYAQEQGIGAYLVLAGVLVWTARRRLAAAWHAMLSRQESPGPEGIRLRWALPGLLVGFIAVWGFMTAAGMAAWVSAIYLLIVLAVALVYGRLRAQTGLPMVWLFPFYMQKNVLLYTFGSQPFAAASPTTLVTWALFVFLARGYYPTITGYQIEAMELTRRGKVRPGHVATAVLLAIAVGIALGWYNHLVPYYQHGAQQLRGGIWGTWVSIPEYRSATQLRDTPLHSDLTRTYATGAGGLMVLLLSFGRLHLASFPFHPLGYAMSCSFGEVLWGSFFVVWLLKSLALRYGGMRFYRLSIPFFLGFALGHFAVAGIFWGLVGAWSGDAVRGYEVFFG